MATIDIRANVTCSLGTLISGSISDDYIQGTGLVKTRGSVELKGIETPDVGEEVTFRYARDGVSRKVPRKLRVLSSFADPYRQITKVELGCKLTLLANAAPAPVLDNEAPVVTGRIQQCQDGYIEYPADSKVPVPISASWLMSECLTRLGLTASSLPLTNYFNVDSFDLSGGYVQALSDLLQSEGYFGYLDASEVLQVCNLLTEGGKGPVIGKSALIDIDAIGVGDLPGEAVFVRYQSLQLKKEPDIEDESYVKTRDWEYEETVGSPQVVEIRYTDPDSGDSAFEEVTFVPYTYTETEYGVDTYFANEGCKLLYESEGANLSDKVVRRTTYQRTIAAEAANNYYSQAFNEGIPLFAYVEGWITKVEATEYDSKGQPARTIITTYEPDFKVAGSLGLDFVYYGDSGGASIVNLTNAPVLVEEVITTYESLYDEYTARNVMRNGRRYEQQPVGQKRTVATYKNWLLTMRGQQAIAQIKENSPFDNEIEARQWLNKNRNSIVLEDCQVLTEYGRTTSVQLRPPLAVRTKNDAGVSAEATAQVAYAMGSAMSDRFVSFSMPLQSDDYYTASGSLIRGDAAAKALRYGRIQNRLLLGNRNGVNLQVHPNKMPSAPFDPLYLSDGDLMVQYRANALNWAFSSDGIVCSVDALFWGVAGGTGTAWVPVAPGITTFPPLPAVEDTTPTAVLGTVATVGTNPQTTLNTAFPAATSGDGVRDETTEDYWVYDGAAWDNVGPTPGPTATTTAVVPPWNEEVPMEGITTTGLVLQDYNYLLDLGTTDIGALVTRTLQLIGTSLAAVGTSYSHTGQAAALKRNYAVQAAAGAFGVSGYGAGSVRSYAIGTNAGTFTSTGQAALLKLGRLPLAAEAGAFTLSSQGAEWFLGKSMTAVAGSFALSGQTASMNTNRVLSAVNGAIALNGQDAVVSITDYFGNWATQTYDYSSLVLPDWWAD